MSGIVDLIKGGYIGQAIIATGLLIGVLYQVFTRQALDPLLTGMLGTVLGFYFHQAVVSQSRNK